MFYCKECSDKEPDKFPWPWWADFALSISYGNCEVCNKRTGCIDN
jgi:hypothetical protein